jgi:murein DD-endopeptidase MepM/ murein hydrolase activator NlpD
MTEAVADTTEATTTATATEQTTQTATSALAATPPPLHELIPEKFHVKRTGEKGEEFDVDASARKVMESYKALEQRIGSGDLPPKTPEEYAVTVPEELKDTLKDFKLSPEFLKGAHEHGITQKGLDFMLANYFKEAPALLAGGIQNSIEATRGNLEKAWGDKYDAEFNAAFKAFQAYASPEDKGKFDDIMRDPSLAYRILAKIGPELGEGGGIPGDTAGGGGESVDDLMKSEAYWNEKHADHAKVSAKVKAHYARKHGTAAVT